uniref:Protein MAK10 homolog n=1 Tax=Anopheles coluzzii TaxID=1518534 RepID=A0A6E8VNM0_ANOCL|nr:N-alpha-acetyltransferase 35, NatC auxiliary subunit [Anopheles coluzzii]
MCDQSSEAEVLPQGHQNEESENPSHPPSNVEAEAAAAAAATVGQMEPCADDWNEITAQFFDCVKDLKLGELVHDSTFGLLEAMSAIEMMDPKMDAGMSCNREATPLTFDTAVETGQIKLNNLLAKESIGIIDAVYSCTVSWLEGHSMAQTVLTCLYLHKPNRIECKTMRSFSIAIQKIINLIRNFIIRANVYEEEDFQHSSFDYNLSEEVTETKAMNMLKAAEEELIKKTKDTEDEREREELQALLARVRFTRLLLHSLVGMYPLKQGNWRYGQEVAAQTAVPLKTEMIDIVKSLNGALELAQAIEKTIELGTQPVEGSDAPNPMGFSMMVNQRLLPPTFPRSTKIKDRQLSIQYLTELIQRIKHACKIANCTSYHAALNFLMDFNKKFTPCLLSRSIPQTLYLPAGRLVFGVKPLIEVLKESVRAFIAPPALRPDNPLYNNPFAINCINSFFEYHEQTFYSLFAICGYNRARQRDHLGLLLLNFAHLQDGAERVDVYLHSLTPRSENSRHLACFGTWVFYHCLRAMSFYLLAGLELELYSVHEYLYIFWYLYQYLFSWIVSALTRAETFLAEQEYAADPKAAKANQKKPKSKKRKTKTDVKEILFNEAMEMLCGGYYKALVGFYKEDRIPEPLPLFDNEQVRFEHRFAPFANLSTPPPMPYSEFRQMKFIMIQSPATELYAAAAKHFHEARMLLETFPNPDEEWHDIVKVAKTNYVMMNLLASGHSRQSKQPPEFDFSCHRYFPIIKQRK